jgi:hypothetical protein
VGSREVTVGSARVTGGGDDVGLVRLPIFPGTEEAGCTGQGDGTVGGGRNPGQEDMAMGPAPRVAKEKWR